MLKVFAAAADNAMSRSRVLRSLFPPISPDPPGL